MIQRITEKSHNQIKIFAPAKINLFLGVTGRRNDGFHELTTLLAKLSIGDSLRIQRVERNHNIKLQCPGFESLQNEKNLAYRAAKLWFQMTEENWAVEVLLDKEIPPMSGLGGGSSDAVSTLIAINELGDNKLSQQKLQELAAEIGSDCPSFLKQGVCIAQGRGERVSRLSHPVAEKLIGQEILLFRPNLGLSTAEVYDRLAKKKKYSSVGWINELLQKWESNRLPIHEILHNDLENAVFAKHIYFPVLFDHIESKYGLKPKLSGSGSCCFLLIPKDFQELPSLKKEISQAWGEDAWVRQCKIIL